MSRFVQYIVERDEDGEVVDLIRIILDPGEGLWAGRYTGGEWVRVPGLVSYQYDPPLNTQDVDEAEANRIIAEVGHLL